MLLLLFTILLLVCLVPVVSNETLAGAIQMLLLAAVALFIARLMWPGRRIGI
jgi:hypothetical protein